MVADAKAKEAKAGGAKAEAECKDGVIEAKAGGVVAKAPCAPPPAAPACSRSAAATEGCSCAGPGSGPGSAGPASEDRWYQCCLAVRAGRGRSVGGRWPRGPQVPQVAAAKTSEEEGAGPSDPAPSYVARSECATLGSWCRPRR